jgi:hypothetical protein
VYTQNDFCIRFGFSFFFSNKSSTTHIKIIFQKIINIFLNFYFSILEIHLLLDFPNRNLIVRKRLVLCAAVHIC